MSQQDYFNLLLGLVAFLGGWWMKVIWSAMKKLEDTDLQMMTKFSSIEVIIAGQYAKKEEVEDMFNKINQKLTKIESLEVAIAKHYVTKADYSHTLDALFKKLDRIEDKLDGKVDKT